MTRLIEILLAKGLSIDLAEEIAKDYFKRETKVECKVELRNDGGSTFNSLTEYFDNLNDAQNSVMERIEGCREIPGEVTGIAVVVCSEEVEYDKYLWVWDYVSERWVQEF